MSFRYCTRKVGREVNIFVLLINSDPGNTEVTFWGVTCPDFSSRQDHHTKLSRRYNPPLWVAFYSPLSCFSLLVFEVS